MSSRKHRRGGDSASVDESAALDELYLGAQGYKTIQLCSQVEEAISMALISSADPILRDLYVVRVEPLRGAALLRVLVATDSGDEIDLPWINEKLECARSYLRAEVAHAIHRKRVPGLEISLIPWSESAR